MLALSSFDAVMAALRGARRISVTAYTLHGPALRALEEAARRGADVRVTLEGRPFDDRDNRLTRENGRVADELRGCGAEAALVPGEHAKSISADGTLYLDGKNWHRGDLIVSESDPSRAAAVPAIKHEALEEERKLIESAKKSDGTIVESESFGCCNAVSAALERLGRAGAAPRLLVCERELRENPRERALLEKLVAEGVRVRVSGDSEKLAACGDGAWLGSANATIAAPPEDIPDWGVRTRDPAIVYAVRNRLEMQWGAARVLA
jgi:hypothetical protein